jgi:hypothetical protein
MVALVSGSVGFWGGEEGGEVEGWGGEFCTPPVLQSSRLEGWRTGGLGGRLSVAGNDAGLSLTRNRRLALEASGGGATGRRWGYLKTSADTYRHIGDGGGIR